MQSSIWVIQIPQTSTTLPENLVSILTDTEIIKIGVNAHAYLSHLGLHFQIQAAGVIIL
jgi:hypothetical protein